jgi:hypothetical protein
MKRLPDRPAGENVKQLRELAREIVDRTRRRTQDV